MKIAFVYDVPYPWHKGGIEQILAREAEALAQEHEVHFFTLRWPGMAGNFSRNGVHYHAFGSTSEEKAYRHGRRSIREAISFAFYSLALFNHDFDAVVTDEFPVLHLLFIRLYQRLRDCKLIIRVDEVWGREYWLSYLGGALGRVGNGIADWLTYSRHAFYVANSNATAKKLRERGVEESHIGVFAPVLDSAIIDKISAGAKKVQRRIIFSGRFIKEKRVDKWLAVFSALSKREKGATGLLIGEGVERKHLESMANTLGLRKKVTIRKFYSKKEDMYRAIASSAGFLHMSEREGLSIIALESLALGTPVVLPDYTPIPEDVKRMCVVVKEKEIPAKLAEIIRSSDKSKYIRHAEGLDSFSTRGIRAFYKKIL